MRDQPESVGINCDRRTKIDRDLALIGPALPHSLLEIAAQTKSPGQICRGF
ncbi:hypothetical protein MPL3356_540040 [Mesorhizobium plurifarium]|uniref:Uncharacterized protein n=1 Tax=Mesorhizobium plurifarium TaxID=69974 RepID=A0A090ECB0_MESPL|nr:hypothetical protein MPL3356_540040 [Mesorhizobium plurifarium]